MTKILDITATTTDERIEAAIPFLDMRAHAFVVRNGAAAVLKDQGDQLVLELHEFEGVTVLFSPAFAYSYVNQHGRRRNESLLIAGSEAASAEDAVRLWARHHR